MKYKKRCDRLVYDKYLNENLGEDVKWLWDMRDGIHIYLMTGTEYGKYSENDYNRAIVTTRQVIEVFNKHT